MKRLLVSFTLFLWMITTCYIVFGSDQLKITELKIKNNNYVPNEAIERIASPLKKKHLLSLLFSSNIRKTLTQNFPQINTITFKVKWPNTVEIHIEEKPEWAIFIQSNQDIIVASDGTLLNTLHQNYHIQNLEDLIIVKGVSSQTFNNKSLDKKLVQNIQKTRREIESFKQNVPVQYQFNPINELSLLYNDEVEIKLGKLQLIKEKFVQLNRFLKINTVALSKIQYIDLRDPEKVVVNYTPE